jgi:hypothetical protein
MEALVLLPIKMETESRGNQRGISHQHSHYIIGLTILYQPVVPSFA